MEGNGIQAVTLLQPSRDIGDTVCTIFSQKIRQQAGGGDTVHIIVAENGDALTPGHGKAHPACGQVHIGQGKGIRQGTGTIQVRIGFLRGTEAPGCQHHGCQRCVTAAHQRVHSIHPRL